MDLPDYVQLSKWLSLFGENIAVGMIVVVLYAAVGPTIGDKRPRLTSVLFGAIFGLSTIVSMSHPFNYAPGVRIDMRDVFVLVGSMSGGPIAAAVTSAIAIAYRVYLGGAGVPIGVGGIVVFALIGLAVALRFGPRVKEFGIGQLLLVGVAAATIDYVYGRTIFAVLGLRYPPPEEAIAIYLLNTVGTVFLGSAVNMTHYRIWHRTQRQLFSIFETTSDLIWENDVEGRFTLISGRVQSILGYLPAEIIGHTNSVFGGHWQDDATEAAYLAAFKARQPYNELKYVFRAKDGSPRIISVSGRPAFDPGGRFTGFRGVAADITSQQLAEVELQQREEELRQSREHLALAQRVARIGSGEADLPSGKLTWTDEWFAILGLDPATVEPSDEVFFNAVHPDDRAQVLRRRDRNFARLDNEPSEYRIVRPNGELRWIHVRTQKVAAASGQIVKVIATLQDITDRKRLELELLEREAQLRRSREHLDRAQKVGQVGSTEFRPSTGETWWSEELYAILGLDPKAARPDRDAYMARVHPDDREMVRQRLEQTAKGVPIAGAEYRIVRPDGEIRWIFAQSEMIRDAKGAVVTVIGTMHDITDPKKAQQERADLERQLNQSQKLEAVGKLTGGVAHDFNNLLTVITGRLEMLGEELEDRPVLREWVRICATAAGRGAALTRSMLAFSRQQPLNPVEIDLSVALRDMVELLPRTLGETIELQFKADSDLWRCNADVSQLQNALLNLALNARDAMPDGGKITIEAGNAHLDEHYAARNIDAVAGDYVLLSVSDTGVGMAPEVIARAFDPFFSTKDPGKGTGLGLSMVYGFARQSGGHVKIYSEVGIGTTLKLYLPRSDNTAPQIEAIPIRRVAPNGNKTIVVVEDDEDMRALAVAQLGRLGYTNSRGRRWAAGPRADRAA